MQCRNGGYLQSDRLIAALREAEHFIQRQRLLRHCALLYVRMAAETERFQNLFRQILSLHDDGLREIVVGIRPLQKRLLWNARRKQRRCLYGRVPIIGKSNEHLFVKTRGIKQGCPYKWHDVFAKHGLDARHDDVVRRKGGSHERAVVVGKNHRRLRADEAACGDCHPHAFLLAFRQLLKHGFRRARIVRQRAKHIWRFGFSGKFL